MSRTGAFFHRVMNTEHETTPTRLDAAKMLASMEIDRQRRRNRSFLVLFSWACIFIAIAMCTCCAGAPAHGVPKYETHTSEPRTVDQQDQSAVKIETACVSGDAFSGRNPMSVNMSAGSGVIISTHRVITAAHVVECDGAVLVHVVTRDGIKYDATIAVMDHSRDFARLDVPRLAAVSTVVLGKAKLGDTVCVAHAWPDRGRSCGSIYKIEWLKLDNGTVDLWTSTRIVPGNSGSGLYNATGELLGLATNNVGCVLDPWRDDCGGLATSLLGRMR